MQFYNLPLFILSLLLLSLLVIFSHYIRLRFVYGFLTALTVFFWVISYFFARLGYNIPVKTPYFDLELYLSSIVFSLIFIIILLVYITEGVKQARDLIVISILIQGLLALMAGSLTLAEVTDHSYYSEYIFSVLFKPAYFDQLISVVVMSIDLFFAVVLFQWLRNKARFIPLIVTFFLSIAVVLTVDSLLFLAGTNSENFSNLIGSHIFFKSVVALCVSLPVGLYIKLISKYINIDLNRGTFDIFSRLHTLEENLEQANIQLQSYIDNLEEKVEKRTQKIKRQQEVIQLELDMASELQKGLLPKNEKDIGLDYAALYKPLSKVSGDIYDFGIIDNNLKFIFLADISGHGVSSAIAGAIIKTIISQINISKTAPGKVLELLSERMLEVTSYHYSTAVYLTYDPINNEIVYANGGHVPPLLLQYQKKENRITELEPTHGILGMLHQKGSRQHRIKLEEPARLLLFTDCLSEQANSAGEQFSEKKIKKILLETADYNPAEVIEVVMAELYEHATEELSDDLTIIVVDFGTRKKSKKKKKKKNKS